MELEYAIDLVIPFHYSRFHAMPTQRGLYKGSLLGKVLVGTRDNWNVLLKGW